MHTRLEIGQEAIVLFVIGPSLVQVCAHRKETEQATRPRHPPCQRPGDDDLIAYVLVDLSPMPHDRRREIGVVIAQEVEIAHMPQLLGQRGGRLHIEKEENALLFSGAVVPARDEVEQGTVPYVLADDCIEQ